MPLKVSIEVGSYQAQAEVLIATIPGFPRGYTVPDEFDAFSRAQLAALDHTYAQLRQSVVLQMDATRLVLAAEAASESRP